MALPNPWYIDVAARHDAAVLRALAELAAEGQEGVRAPGHLAVRALSTPGAAITVDPGVYSVRNTAAGAGLQTYVGTVDTAESWAVSPTDASGPRTDLVIVRIENPSAIGTGSWPTPADPLNGPYAFVRVIEGVPANTQTVKSWDSTWTALTLARITRPASTGVVTQAHITDLRSLIDLRSERIVVINNPPATPPPIAQDYWTACTPCTAGDELLPTHTDWRDFPSECTWQVPVPSWAISADIQCIVNPAMLVGSVYGQLRVVWAGDTTNVAPTTYDENFFGQVRPVQMVGGAEYLDPAIRGKVVTVKLQGKSLDSSYPGKLKASRGTRASLWINFKRYPTVE